MQRSGPNFHLPGCRGSHTRALRQTIWACWAVSSMLLLVPAAQAEETLADSTTLPVALQHIYASGVPHSLDELRLMDEHQRALVERLQPVTVGIGIKSTQGSGVIISADGYVLTAAHVAGEANRQVDIMTSDGRTWSGMTLGMYKTLDAALIKITAASHGAGDEQSAAEEQTWPYAAMGDSANLRPGSWCLALGHPGGFQPDRQAPVRFGRVLTVNKRVIETDCILIGGDSGGPLFDMEGRVVGVHSRIGVGLTKNLHVPVHAYQDNWKRLARGESWGDLRELTGPPRIGVKGEPGVVEARIFQVLPASPAEAAGLRSGDLVVRVGDEGVSTFDDLKQSVARLNPGDDVTVIVLRGTERKEFTVIIGAGSAQ